MNSHKFVEQELKKKGLHISPITEDYINLRLNDFMKFVNDILEEYKDIYKLWEPKPVEWFINPMIDKWKFSYVIEKQNGEIALFNFTSVYGKNLHNHCTYVHKKMRGMNLAKYHLIKICQVGIENGFENYEGYWDKRNNGSLILHLKLGFKIVSMRKNEQLLLVGNLNEIKEYAMKQLKAN